MVLIFNWLVCNFNFNFDKIKTKSLPLPGREKEKIDEKNDEKNNPIQSIIIDCSCMNYIDSQGVSTLLMVWLIFYVK